MTMWKDGEYVALLESGMTTLRCAIIDRVKPAQTSVVIGTRQFNCEGRELWVPFTTAASIFKLTPERESDIAASMELPAVGSSWMHDEDPYVVLDLTNIGSRKPDFLPTVVYQAPSGGTKYSRSVVRWHARMTRAPVAVVSENFRSLAKPSRCQARQWSDAMRCASCGTTWDTNDPEPPTCVVTGDAAPASGNE